MARQILLWHAWWSMIMHNRMRMWSMQTMLWRVDMMQARGRRRMARRSSRHARGVRGSVRSEHKRRTAVVVPAREGCF